MFKTSSIRSVAYFALALSFIVTMGFAQAQNLVLNGSFETNTVLPGGEYNLTNSVFNSKITDVVAYSNGNNADFYNIGAEGDWSIALASDQRTTSTESIAITLDSTLVLGQTYTVSFYQRHLGGNFSTFTVELTQETEGYEVVTTLPAAVSQDEEWVCVTSTVTGAGRETHINFTPVAPTNWFVHMLVDDVKIQAGVVDGCPPAVVYEQLDNVVTGASGGGVVFGGIIPDDGLTVPDAPSVAVNSGMLDAPAYYSRLEQRHFNMTYNTGDQIPLSFALGIGTGGDFWHRNTEIVVSQIDNDRPDDESQVGALSGGATSTGFTVTRTAGANSRGPGTLQAVGELVFDGGSTLEVTHTYEVVENTNFVKATTSVRSTSGTVPNVNMWVGTSDDWVGVTDSPTSSLGLVTGEGVNATFAAKCNGPTNAVLVQSDAEFLMLYSPDISYAQAVLSALIEVFDSVINVAPEDLSNWVYESEWVEGQPEFEHNTSIVDQNPKASAYGIETNDGAHALALKYGDVGTTPVSRTWYYQAGILPDVPFDVCPNPQQQIFGVYTEGPEMVPVNSLGGLLVLITMVLGVAVFVVRGRM
jgi:hypothetical protein